MANRNDYRLMEQKESLFKMAKGLGYYIPNEFIDLEMQEYDYFKPIYQGKIKSKDWIRGRDTLAIKHPKTDKHRTGELIWYKQFKNAADIEEFLRKNHESQVSKYNSSPNERKERTKINYDALFRRVQEDKGFQMSGKYSLEGFDGVRHTDKKGRREDDEIYLKKGLVDEIRKLEGDLESLSQTSDADDDEQAKQRRQDIVVRGAVATEIEAYDEGDDEEYYDVSPVLRPPGRITRRDMEEVKKRKAAVKNYGKSFGVKLM